MIWVTYNTYILNTLAINYVGRNTQYQARFKSFYSILCGLLEESKQKIGNNGVTLPSLIHLTEILTSIGNKITHASNDLDQLKKEEIQKPVLGYTQLIIPTDLIIK